MNYFRRQIAAVSFVVVAGLVVMTFTLAGCDKIMPAQGSAPVQGQAPPPKPPEVMVGLPIDVGSHRLRRFHRPDDG